MIVQSLPSLRPLFMPIKVALLTTDNREHERTYDEMQPRFGPAIESVLQGMACLPELEIHVVSCTQKPMHAPEKLSDNTWFHLLDVPKIGWLRTGYQGCLRAIRRKLRELQPDIVHGEGTERECALSAAFSGFPNVVTIHGNMRELAKLLNASVGSYLWSAAVLERFTLSRAGGVLCNSAYTESGCPPSVPLEHGGYRMPFAIGFFEPLPAVSTSHPEKPKAAERWYGCPTGSGNSSSCSWPRSAHSRAIRFEIQFIGAANSRDPYVTAFYRQIENAELSGFARYLGEKSLPDLISLMDSASALVHVPSEESFRTCCCGSIGPKSKILWNARGRHS